MTTFIIALICLLFGYIFYGALVQRVFGADKNRQTPCFTQQDGVDFIPLPTWKVFLIQFLNIAGTGPIFGAILGILFGPAAYLWIVLGCIFAGAVHDYLSGMISMRKNGASLPEIIGDELGKTFRVIALVFSMFLMILVGAVFITTPAGLLANLTQSLGDKQALLTMWIAIIFVYYLLATLLPIDKLIGKIYPVFGLALLIMALGVLWGIFSKEGNLPEITEAFHNHHPKNLPIFPAICITIACGAISGFHATQSPLMARCMQNERLGKPVFYGAMITEGFVALIWAAAAIKFADSLGVDGDTPYQKLLVAMTDPETGKQNPAIIVNAICNTWMGKFGALLAILGVVAAPITSGDTALRSARLILADFLKLNQKKIYSRILLAIPIFALAFLLICVNFDILWRYFGWTNQMIGTFTLWALTVYLAKRGRWAYFITLIPAIWMTIVCTTYIFVVPEGFNLQTSTATMISGPITAIILIAFIIWMNTKNKDVSISEI